jgi:cellulose synthase/poly-beta-1,6-N-acetylglucosamine synthase-like glycosyltransferase
MNAQFSLIIPVKELNKYLIESVPRIQQLIPNVWELIIVTDLDGPNYWEDDPRVKLISSGRVTPGGKRDLGASISSGDYLIFLDDDSFPSLEFLEKVKSSFQMHLDCVAIGGPGVTPPESGLFERASGAFYESAFSGADSDRYVQVGAPKFVDDWPSVNFSIQRKAFIEIGGFGSEFWPGEDTYLCNKIIERGMKIKYDPEVVVYHHRRETLKAHLKQIRGYGFHRGNFARHLRGNSRRFKYYVPSLFSLFTLVTPLIVWQELEPFSSISKLIFATYLFAVLCISIKIFIKSGLLVSMLFPAYALLSHLNYGIFFILGYIKSKPVKSKLR